SSAARKPAGLSRRARTCAAAENPGPRPDAARDRAVLVEPHAARIRHGDRRLAGHPWHPGRTARPRRSGVMRAAPLSEWLKQHDLERFLGIFEENEVDLATLRMLSESDLTELGLPFGPRKRIINLLREEKAQEKSGG